jgi:hypothetical protein
MNKHFHIFALKLLAFLLILLNTACLDEEINTYESDAQSKLDNYLRTNNYTEAEHIGYGIYVRITDGDDDTKPKPVYPNTINLNYTGRYTDGRVFESTDSNLVTQVDFKDYFIYGPKRLKLGNLIFGFDTAMRTLPLGATAQIVIPHRYAFGNYEPVVYDVELLEIIENDSTWEADMFEAYLEEHGFDTSKYIAEGLYYKSDSDLNWDTPRSTGDSVDIELTGRFAELYDETSRLGRVFYPRPIENLRVIENNNISEYLLAATSIYPITRAIDSTVKYMDIGQVVEIAVMSGAEAPSAFVWGYGAGGIVNELNSILIPPYTPLHYTIKLLDAEE